MLDVHSIACSRPASAGRLNVSGVRGSVYKKVNNKETTSFDCDFERSINIHAHHILTFYSMLLVLFVRVPLFPSVSAAVAAVLLLWLLSP